MKKHFDLIAEMQSRRVACGCDKLPVEPETCKVEVQHVCFKPCASAIRIADYCACFCDCGCGCVHMKPIMARNLARMNLGRIVDAECCEMSDNACGECADPCEKEMVAA